MCKVVSSYNLQKEHSVDGFIPKVWSFILRNRLLSKILVACRYYRYYTLQQLRKAKYSILASILHIFQQNFLTEPHTYLCNTLRKSHGFLKSCFEYGKISQKRVFLEKFILSLFFEQDPILESFNRFSK